MSYLRPTSLSGVTSQRRGPRVAMVSLSDDATGTSPTPSAAAVTQATAAAMPPATSTNTVSPYLTYALIGGAAYLGYKFLFGKKKPASEPSAA